MNRRWRSCLVVLVLFLLAGVLAGPRPAVAQANAEIAPPTAPPPPPGEDPKHKSEPEAPAHQYWAGEAWKYAKNAYGKQLPEEMKRFFEKYIGKRYPSDQDAPEERSDWCFFEMDRDDDCAPEGVTCLAVYGGKENHPAISDPGPEDLLRPYTDYSANDWCSTKEGPGDTTTGRGGNDIIEGSAEADEYSLRRGRYYEGFSDASNFYDHFWDPDFYGPDAGGRFFSRGLWIVGGLSTLTCTQRQHNTPSAYLEAEQRFHEAVEAYQDGNYDRAAWLLGYVTHYLEDMSATPHVTIDPHPSADWYEDYFARADGDWDWRKDTGDAQGRDRNYVRVSGDWYNDAPTLACPPGNLQCGNKVEYGPDSVPPFDPDFAKKDKLHTVATKTDRQVLDEWYGSRHQHPCDDGVVHGDTCPKCWNRGTYNEQWPEEWRYNGTDDPQRFELARQAFMGQSRFFRIMYSMAEITDDYPSDDRVSDGGNTWNDFTEQQRVQAIIKIQTELIRHVAALYVLFWNDTHDNCFFTDADGDGTNACVDPHDGVDPGCDQSESVDRDGDGFCVDEQTGEGTDCDDSDPEIHPGAEERPDGVDNDCDGLVDENYDCRDGETRPCPDGTDVGACERGIQRCIEGHWQEGCEGQVGPQPESCEPDGIDQDCNGVPDDGDCAAARCRDRDDFWRVKKEADDRDGSLVEDIGIKIPEEMFRRADINGDGLDDLYMIYDPYRQVDIWGECWGQRDDVIITRMYDPFDNYPAGFDFGCAARGSETPSGDRDAVCGGAGYQRPSQCDTYYETTLMETQTGPPVGYLEQQHTLKCIGHFDPLGDSYAMILGGHYEMSREHGYLYDVFVVRCGTDEDCGAGYYCHKEDLYDVTTFECRPTCGNGVCDPGEVCPEDGQGPEVCDGIDNDCDGAIDEGLSRPCGSDNGECRLGTQVCRDGAWSECEGAVPPRPEVCNGLDDDCDGTVDDGLEVICSADAECGTAGCTDRQYRVPVCLDAGTCQSRCDWEYPGTDADGDGWDAECECNDSNPAVNPGATEVCDNGIDDDCDGLVDGDDVEDCGGGGACPDADHDGYAACDGTCEPPQGVPCGDCDDGDGSVYPGATQACDGKNNDCDDPAWPEAPADEQDADGDGYRPCSGDCDDGDAGVHPGAAELCDNGIDDDCDGKVDREDEDCSGSTCPDRDGDGWAVCNGECSPAPGDQCGDCDDSNAGIHPGAEESCDGLDNDCDPSTPDGASEPWLGAACDGPDSDFCQEGEYVCDAGEQECTDDTGDDVEGPAGDATCSDGVDNDCDGLLDGDDPGCSAGTCPDLDNDGWAVCDGSCEPDVGDQCGDCDDSDPLVHPGMPEYCDGRDNDCDPATEDGSGEDWWNDPCDGPDSDYCEEGTWTCSQGAQECTDDTDDSLERYGAGTSCADGVDNDCDGLTDMDDPQCAPPGEFGPRHPEPGTRFRTCDPPATFTWGPGDYVEFRTLYARVDDLARPARAYGWFRDLQWTPTPSEWLDILSLVGDEGTTIYWGVDGRNPGGRATSGSSFFLVAEQAASIPTEPAPGAEVSASGPAPVFRWDPGECNVAFRLEMALTPTFERPYILFPGEPLREPEWSPDYREWLLFLGNLGPALLQEGGTVYWRVVAYDPIGRERRSATSSFVVTP